MIGFRTNLLIICSVLFLSACSTTRSAKNERKGLFDKWEESGQSDGSRKTSGDRHPTQVDYKRLNDSEASASSADWTWPLETNSVSSPFGRRKRKFHEGIDLRANVGTPVFASREGVVFYSGRKIKGYGKLVIIKHEGGYFTIYAHNSQLFVKEGQEVEQGQKIALSGKSGRVRGPHVHFELRRGSVALNPIKYLPEKDQSSLANVPEREPATATENKKRKKRKS
jgi:murein DD-endopeptidase MepM/ murein hydrolase activator NlpD